MSFCQSCRRGLSLSGLMRPTASKMVTVPRYITTTSTRYNDRDNHNEELERAKARAWYLDPAPKPELSSTPQAGPSTPTPRKPRFTTFDPDSTRSDLQNQEISPLPPNASSPLLHKLHDHLTRSSDSVDHASVRFLHTPSSSLLKMQEGVEGSLLGESGGTSWEWVVTCQVKGRGRGVLNRAEKEIRKWMRETLGKRTRTRTASREESDTDWSMVHVGEGVCVNLFTAEGKERWNLEELWAGSKEGMVH